jgi:DNA-binding NarL/FixJ family response regulator
MNVAATTTLPAGTGLRPATGRTVAATLDPVAAPEPAGTGSARTGARVLVCDDHLVFAESLAMVFVDAGYRVTAVTRSIDEVLGVLRACPVDVCVLDVGLGLGDRFERLAELRATAPATHLVLLGGRGPRQWAPDALAAGASGLVDKGQHVAAILDTVARVCAGDTVVGPPYRQLPRRGAVPELFRLAGFLTPREREVLCRLVRGEHTAALARSMGVTSATARCHVQNVLTKLGAHTRLEAVTAAVRCGLIDAATGEWLAG